MQERSCSHDGQSSERHLGRHVRNRWRDSLSLPHGDSCRGVRKKIDYVLWLARIERRDCAYVSCALVERAMVHRASQRTNYSDAWPSLPVNCLKHRPVKPPCELPEALQYQTSLASQLRRRIGRPREGSPALARRSLLRTFPQLCCFYGSTPKTLMNRWGGVASLLVGVSQNT